MGTLKIIFAVIYLIIGIHTSINIPAVTGLQYLLAVLISGGIGKIADLIIFELSFSLAGNFKDVIDLDKYETSCVHWISRSFFALVYFFIAKQLFMTELVLKLTIKSYDILLVKSQEIMNQLISIMTHNINT